MQWSGNWVNQKWSKISQIKRVFLCFARTFSHRNEKSVPQIAMHNGRWVARLFKRRLRPPNPPQKILLTNTQNQKKNKLV